MLNKPIPEARAVYQELCRELQQQGAFRESADFGTVFKVRGQLSLVGTSHKLRRLGLKSVFVQWDLWFSDMQHEEDMHYRIKQEYDTPVHYGQ